MADSSGFKTRRSRTGCLTCRQRKLKCDEAKPVCGQCSKAQRSCQQSDGITFRHEQNASMNGSTESLKTFYSYKNTFNDDHVWLDVPDQVTFVNITDPYAADMEMDPEDSLQSRELIPSPDANMTDWQTAEVPDTPAVTAEMQIQSGLDALSAAASADSYAYIPFPSPDRPSSITQTTRPQSAYSSPSHSHSLSAHSVVATCALSSPMSRRSDGSPIDPNLDVRLQAQEVTSQPAAEKESDHDKAEAAFLMRHYAEVLGKSMDLFDCGHFFAYHVPVKALEYPLLKYAACAYAAKQLARVGGSKPVLGACSKQAQMEIWPNMEKTDWQWVGAKYYDRAINLLLGFLGQQQADDREVELRSNPQPHSKTSDELLAAAAILSEYEAMDIAGAWSRHLNGTKTLLDIAEIGMRPAGDSARDIENTKLFAGSRKAIFWNFARQDFAAAFINESTTRLDVNNFAMWKAAGLDLDSSGVLQSNDDPILRSRDKYSLNDNHSREDMVSNALILLLSKLNNFVITGECLYAAPGGRITQPDDIGVSQKLLLERWHVLREELDTWYRSLPDTFRISARATHPVFEEIWYSIPMAASAMQNYHFARILLMINKPHETTALSTIAVRMKSYQSITAKITIHAREIVGIALSRPEAAVRIFSSQALYTAGQVLTGPRERQVIIDLLRNIEKDLGWATEFRVQQLLREWNDEESTDSRTI